MTNGVACHSDGGGEDNSICQILQMRMRMRTVDEGDFEDEDEEDDDDGNCS